MPWVRRRSRHRGGVAIHAKLATTTSRISRGIWPSGSQTCRVLPWAQQFVTISPASSRGRPTTTRTITLDPIDGPAEARARFAWINRRGAGHSGSGAGGRGSCAIAHQAAGVADGKRPPIRQQPSAPTAADARFLNCLFESHDETAGRDCDLAGAGHARRRLSDGPPGDPTPHAAALRCVVQPTTIDGNALDIRTGDIGDSS